MIITVLTALLWFPGLWLPVPPSSSPLPAPVPAPVVQEDEEDEADEAPVDPEQALTDAIRGRLSELTAGRASYDGKMLRVHYDDPGEFEPDHAKIGSFDEEHLEFRPRHVRVKGEDGIFCFAGNSGGGLLLRPHYRGQVRTDARVHYQWVDRGGHFMTLVHASDDAFRGADFGVRPVEKESKKKVRFRPSKVKGYNADASKWMDRTVSHRQVVEVDEAGTMSIVFDATTGGSRKADDDLPDRGRVGFLWDKVKFVVIELEVVGELDRDWAAERLGLEKVEPTDDSDGEDDDDAEDTEDGSDARYRD